MKDNRKRFKHARTSLIISLIGSCVLLATCIFKALFLNNADADTFVFSDYYLLVQGLHGLGLIIYAITFIISAIFFILWFRRCYYNLSQKIDYLKHSEGWAAGGWFTPVLNLYVPYQIMVSIVEEYQLLLGIKINDDHYKNVKFLVGIWWALYLTSGTVFRFSDRILSNALPDHISANYLVMLSIVLSFGAGIILIYIMNKVRGLEDSFRLLNSIEHLNKRDDISI